MIFRKLLNYKPKNIFTNLYSFAKFKRDKPHINGITYIIQLERLVISIMAKPPLLLQ